MKIGAMLESFHAPTLRQGLAEAAKLQVQGVQAYASFGELSPENMNRENIKLWKDLLDSRGMVFSAICGDFGGHGFEDEEENPRKVTGSKRVIDLAKELGCNIVTTHIGSVPANECAKKDVMRKACRELALYADSIGSAFAVETGPETASVLLEFLDSLGAGGVRVNYDPANLIMCVADDPVAGVATLGKYIVHTHAKDGVQLSADPVTYEELPLGKGGVDWDAYLKALHGINFTGFLTIEREVGENPAADIRMAAEFLRNKLKELGI